MPPIRSAWIWIKVCMRWTRPPSTCACPFSPGRDSANTKPPSRCTRCWICTATSPRLSALPMEKCMMSTSSTRFCRRLGRSTSWTAATWISGAFLSSRSAQRSSSYAPSPTFCFSAATRTPVDKTTGVRSDHTVILTAIDSAKAYPDALRRVSYLDVETRKRFKFLTNNFTLPALTIAQIYKCRWQVELFFKWIKQHLRIKAFYGTSENAVKTQIWIAVSVYVLVAIVRKRLGLEASLYQILQILSVTLFEKTPVLRALQASDFENDSDNSGNQLILFDF